MGDVEHGISIYWKDHEMEEKAIDWKMLEWLIVSLWIDLSPTALQGDSRLAAAPLTPGTLLVSHSNLGKILSSMEKATLVHRSGWSNLVYQDLKYVREHTIKLQAGYTTVWLFTATLSKINRLTFPLTLTPEWIVLTGCSADRLLSAVWRRTSRFSRELRIQACCSDNVQLSFRQPYLLGIAWMFRIVGGSNLAEIKQSKPLCELVFYS